MDKPWTFAEREILKLYWKPETAAQVAARLGRTRNAVIGQAHKLGLESKKRGYKRPDQRKMEIPMVAKVKVVIGQAPISVPMPPIPLLEAGRYQCKAIAEGKDEYGLAMVCGKPVDNFQFYSFCAEHMGRFTQKRNS